jgi:hypothetical protein
MKQVAIIGLRMTGADVLKEVIDLWALKSHVTINRRMA